jgi:hypothetical protein
MADDSSKNKHEAELLKILDAINLCALKEIDPQDPEPVILARKWATLVDELVIGEGSIIEELRAINSEDINDFREQFGEVIPNEEIMEYIRKSLED